MIRFVRKLIPMSLVGIVCLCSELHAQTPRIPRVATTNSASPGDEPAAAAAATNSQYGDAASVGLADEYSDPGPQRYHERSAFSVNYQPANPVQRPELMLHSEISEKERQELTEDLQILATLLEKAVTVSGSRQPDQNRVLGVRVLRSSLPASISYLQDFGIQFRLQTSQLSFAKSAEANGQSGDTKEESEETDWDIARREFLAERQGVGAAYVDYVQAAPSARHDEKSVEAIIEQVTKALDNIGRVRFPASATGTKQIVSVYLTCPADGSVLSIRKCIQCAADPKDSMLEPVTTHRYMDPAVKNSEHSAQLFLFGYPSAASIPPVEHLRLPPGVAPPAAVAPVAPTAPSTATRPRQ